jgi:hypothetical protein
MHDDESAPKQQKKRREPNDEAPFFHRFFISRKIVEYHSMLQRA